MPLVGIETYNIDFLIFESNDPKTITLLDRSRYLSTPEKPVLDITLPGYTGFIEVPYTPNSIITLDSDSLQLTEPCDYDELADLPDGVYQITMKVCPYDELFMKKCFIKTANLQALYQNLLIGLDLPCTCIDEQKLKKELIDIELLIQSSKAETTICNVEKATLKYQTAFNKIQRLIKKVKCK